MKTKIKVVLCLSAVLAAVGLSALLSVRAVASCNERDDKYGYTLICEGETGSCKFINPDGKSTICPGNKGDAIPDKMESIGDRTP